MYLVRTLRFLGRVRRALASLATLFAAHFAG
jgi:hypothetical protein